MELIATDFNICSNSAGLAAGMDLIGEKSWLQADPAVLTYIEYDGSSWCRIDDCCEE